jgi:hypothetical protein
MIETVVKILLALGLIVLWIVLVRAARNGEIK